MFSLVLAFSVASPLYPLPAWDDYLVTQPYPGWQSGSVPCESGPGYMLAEDCYPTVDFVPYTVELWLGFEPPVLVNQYNFAFQQDQSGEPEGISFWYGTETDVTYQELGLWLWGLSYHYVVVDIDDPPTLTAGQTCWFCFQAVSSNPVGCLVRYNNPNWFSQCYVSYDNGETWQSSQSAWGPQYGIFMIISGATGLDRTTWGTLKALPW